MSQSNSRRVSGQLQALRRGWSRAPGLPAAAVLPTEVAEAAFQAEQVKYRDRLYSPLVTLYVFLGQILDPDCCCRQAVARVVAWLMSLGRAACSSGTGAYCQARKRLPEGVLARLTRDTGKQLHDKHRQRWHWHGHAVKLMDGSMVTAPDTAANQKAYPQPRTQKAGLGFPMIRMVVLFSWSVGTVLDAAFCPYKGKQTGETALWRALRHNLEPGDILLTDRYHCSYWEMAEAQRHGTQVVARVHARRKVDFRKGRRLGKDDQLMTWTRRRGCPEWMDPATYALVPETLTVRVIRIRVPKGRNRSREIVVATTLLDPCRYPKGEIAALYRLRWQAEISLRALKQTMQMDMLRCKTPAMLHKEIWGHFLTYNLLRTVLAQAAEAHELNPWQISFKGTLQTLNAFATVLDYTPPECRADIYRELLAAVATHRVGNRPDRYEPRAVKRRPKPYPSLNEPRRQARGRLRKES
jgi:Transposase DDE domain